jgi:SAM-dependent methyltransferase
MTANTPLPEFLAALGKTELKPGGTYATSALLRKLDLKGPDHVLVVGPNAGSTALYVSVTHKVTTEALVRSQAENVTENDPSLSRRSTARIGRADQMPFPDAHFDAVMVEATLSYQTPAEQRATLKEINRVLKRKGRLGLHELAWRQPPTPELEQGLKAVWGAEIYPQVVRGWWDRIEGAGFRGIENEQAVISYFTRKGLEADEGHEVALHMFHNALEDPRKLERFTAAYQEFARNRRYYGVIIARAEKA